MVSSTVWIVIGVGVGLVALVGLGSGVALGAGHIDNKLEWRRRKSVLAEQYEQLQEAKAEAAVDPSVANTERVEALENQMRITPLEKAVFKNWQSKETQTESDVQFYQGPEYNRHEDIPNIV